MSHMEVFPSANDIIYLKWWIKTILSAAHIVSVSGHGWKQFYPQLILSLCHIVDGNNSDLTLKHNKLQMESFLSSTSHRNNMSCRSNCFNPQLRSMSLPNITTTPETPVNILTMDRTISICTVLSI